MSNTILLKGSGVFAEGNAGGAIVPGDLINLTAAKTVVAHNVAAGTAVKAFAVEQDVVGRDIDTAYAVGERVQYVLPAPGAEIFARLPAAAAAVVTGDFLESAGDGTLRKVVADTATASSSRNSVVAQALEDVDNSAGGTAVRIKVRIL